MGSCITQYWARRSKNVYSFISQTISRFEANFYSELGYGNDTVKVPPRTRGRVTNETYYERKTVLLDTDHDSKTFDSSAENYVTYGKTLHFEPKNRHTQKTSNNISQLTVSLPTKIITPQAKITPKATSLGTSKTTGPVEDALPKVREPLVEPPIVVIWFDRNNLRRTIKQRKHTKFDAKKLALWKVRTHAQIHFLKMTTYA